MIRIQAPGARATVQDRGRLGHLREGVPPSGPADPFAFAAAQALVGNVERAAAIEIVGGPFVFSCDDRRLVAVTGRDAALAGRDRMDAWRSVFARAGESLTVLAGSRSRFLYLAVSGGITTEPMLGSRAAYPPAALGRALRAGDSLPLGDARVDPERAGRTLAAPDYETGQIRAITGPHDDRFPDEANATFFSSAFSVELASDRMATRLAGPRIGARAAILTCGVVAGAVQVPSGGQPIVLLADHQATGGYPVIATVVGADLGLVAQRLSGEALRFVRVEAERAVAALRDARNELAAIA